MLKICWENIIEHQFLDIIMHLPGSDYMIGNKYEYLSLHVPLRVSMKSNIFIAEAVDGSAPIRR